MSGLHSFFSILRQFFPPDLSWNYLRALLKEPVPQTLEMAAGAMLFSTVIGLLTGLYVGARLPGSRLVYGLLASVRAIPDLTMAILFVIIFGIGAPAGMLALATFYAAAMGKIFADLFVSANPEPVEAMYSTGAGRLMVALYALLPLRARDLLTYGSYEFESKMRACVIVGAVGAGGLGTELVGTIYQLDFRRTTTIIILLVLLIAIIDRLGWVLRRYPGLLLPLAVLGMISAWINRPQMFAFQHTLKTVRDMFPPSLPATAVHQLPLLIGQTIFIAVAGTLLAVVMAIPLGLAAARNLSPPLLYISVRRLLELLRAIPDLVWGLLLVTTAMVGPMAGALAIGLHSAGVFGKLYSESLENVQPEPVAALASTGGPRLAIAGFGLLPLAFPPMLVHTLFRFEWNLRAATIVGMIGAGGIGQALFNSQQLMFYNQTLAYVIITWVMVMMVDLANAQLRHKLKAAESAA
ncbi:MAG TPA: phosphonate ABC transporter, permease protein PhnE [Candidatus Angelobacter sp.]|nr:phosphonate ABC transporter, permease protein PhnE [Candidatus Angelobacter sp.]